MKGRVLLLRLMPLVAFFGIVVPQGASPRGDGVLRAVGFLAANAGKSDGP